MNSCAYELLAIIFAFKTFHCPELIPRPQDLRADPRFSDALDFLIDSGFVTVSLMNHDHACVSAGTSAICVKPSVEVISITRDGVQALGAGLTGWYAPYSGDDA